MISTLELAIATICAVQPDAYVFQSETVTYEDMTRGAIVVDVIDLLEVIGNWSQ